LGQLYAEGRAVVSTQVLQEFCNVGLKKLGLTSPQLQDQLHFLRQLEVVLITPDMLNQALSLHQTHQVSFYDALIVTAAQASHCTTIYSEDFNAGEVLGGAKIINPFV
jgi:predicted nucleic acid-binding protein